MEKNSRKEKLVKQLLNRDFDVTDEDELIEMLLDSPTAIDSDKEEDEKNRVWENIIGCRKCRQNSNKRRCILYRNNDGIFEECTACSCQTSCRKRTT